MEPFFNLPPSSTIHHLPSPHSPLRKLDLQAITNDWLSLTMEPRVSTPAGSLAGTPVPPTPPPLPTNFTPFLKAQEPKAPSPAPSQRGFTLPPRTGSRKPPPTFKEGIVGLDHSPVVLPFSQPPPPDPHSLFTSLLPDPSVQCNNGRGIRIAKRAQPLHQTEIFSDTQSEPLKSSTQVPLWHKSTFSVDKTSKTPDVVQNVKDPYDQLLLMFLDAPISAEDGEPLRLSPAERTLTTPNNEPQSKFKLKAESSQPAAKPPAVAPLSKSTSHIRLEVHKPVTMEPLSICWDGQSKTLSKQPVETQRPPSVKGKGYELFIEEEDDEREDKEEDVRLFNGRLTPQVAHAVG